jgi:hypothetical protein
MAAGRFYKASERTAEKTLLPPFILLLGYVAICADGTENTVSLLSLQSLLR